MYTDPLRDHYTRLEARASLFYTLLRAEAARLSGPLTAFRIHGDKNTDPEQVLIRWSSRVPQPYPTYPVVWLGYEARPLAASPTGCVIVARFDNLTAAFEWTYQDDATPTTPLGF